MLGQNGKSPILARRDKLHRRTTSVANRGIAEIDRPPSGAEDDPHDPKETRSELLIDQLVSALL